jgi:hypothetical protein
METLREKETSILRNLIALNTIKDVLDITRDTRTSRVEKILRCPNALDTTEESTTEKEITWRRNTALDITERSTTRDKERPTKRNTVLSTTINVNTPKRCSRCTEIDSPKELDIASTRTCVNTRETTENVRSNMDLSLLLSARNSGKDAKPPGKKLRLTSLSPRTRKLPRLRPLRRDA